MRKKSSVIRNNHNDNTMRQSNACRSVCVFWKYASLVDINFFQCCLLFCNWSSLSDWYDLPTVSEVELRASSLRVLWLSILLGQNPSIRESSQKIDGWNYGRMKWEAWYSLKLEAGSCSLWEHQKHGLCSSSVAGIARNMCKAELDDLLPWYHQIQHDLESDSWKFQGRWEYKEGVGTTAGGKGDR